MSKRTGTIYLTIRQKEIGGWGDHQFTVVRASTRFHAPAVGEVTIPLKITLDDAWFTRRTQRADIAIQDCSPVDVQAQEATR